eukprot:m.135712 g.135712  ORF g.135712 m.135712 type:complete len:71 (+) comp17565_c0_seq3:954-1166(+)
MRCMHMLGEHERPREHLMLDWVNATLTGTCQAPVCGSVCTRDFGCNVVPKYADNKIHAITTTGTMGALLR